MGSTPSPADQERAAISDDTDPQPAPNARWSRARIGLGLALPIILLAGLIIAATRTSNDSANSTAPPLPAPHADGPECAALLPKLPDELGGSRTVQLTEPVPPGTRTWRRADGTGLIVLRCGLERPAEFTVGAALQQIDDVLWFGAPDQHTWYVVDRAVYLGLTLPGDAGATPLQDLSTAIAAVLPARPIDPAPLPR